MKPGDTFTIAGLTRKVPNPARKWWQVWRPRMIDTRELQTWTIVARNSTGWMD
jgi:hypothetical protein